MCAKEFSEASKLRFPLREQVAWNCHGWAAGQEPKLAQVRFVRGELHQARHEWAAAAEVFAQVPEDVARDRLPPHIPSSSSLLAPFSCFTALPKEKNTCAPDTRGIVSSTLSLYSQYTVSKRVLYILPVYR